jgi:hypothetical protein
MNVNAPEIADARATSLPQNCKMIFGSTGESMPMTSHSKTIVTNTKRAPGFASAAAASITSALLSTSQ